ncbi:MAG: membrane protein insertase YidC [Clostridia bacterium]|nr:membrane protein insertase YidC [Clostridia bacterium]
MEFLNILAETINVYDVNLQNVELTGLTKLVSNVIDFFSFGGYIAVGILLFSLILKIIPLPLDIYSRVANKKNALRMERMRPELEKLQKQYANNKELYQKKMMALYKKEGYSTFASCLPTIFTLVFFILVISAFNQFSTYSKVKVFNEMAISYSDSIRYNENVKVYECEVEGKEPYVYYDHDNNPDTALVVMVDANNQPIYDEARLVTDKSTMTRDKINLYRYTVESEEVLNDVELIAQNKAADRYFELAGNQKFLWVKNIWIEDLPWKKAFVSSDAYKTIFTYTKGCSCKTNEIKSDITVEGVYEKLTGSPRLNEVKSQPNGYMILVLLSIGSMILSQLVLTKSQKAQLELQSVDQTAAQTNKMMTWMMPVMFGVFSFMYTASFSLYLIVSTLFSMLSTIIINKIVEKKFIKDIEKQEEEKNNKRYAYLSKNKDKEN